jgi:hypothetical protein
MKLLKGQIVLLGLSVLVLFVAIPFVDNNTFWRNMGIFVPALITTTFLTAYYTNEDNKC